MLIAWFLIWFIEHYLSMMLKRNQFDAIVHEHLEYYSLPFSSA